MTRAVNDHDAKMPLGKACTNPHSELFVLKKKAKALVFNEIKTNLFRTIFQ